MLSFLPPFPKTLTSLGGKHFPSHKSLCAVSGKGPQEETLVLRLALTHPLPSQP